MAELQLGFDILRSYKRLSYEPWSALAEFVDNSTQSFFNHRGELAPVYDADGTTLTVHISYDKAGGSIVIEDNAMGMNEQELGRALIVGSPPADISGRSRYGMGMKTAACWLGDRWTVRTTRLGSTEELMVTVDVDQVARGDNVLPLERKTVASEEHYTIIDVTELNRSFHGRTLGKIREYLSSMYRHDLDAGDLILVWQDQELTWARLDDTLQSDGKGGLLKREFDFTVNGKRAHGWGGVLDKGSRAKAGFSILHAGRVIRGWPESWRPETIYGQLQGSNNLVNQRLVGELNLDDFEVTHTKDDILWEGTEQEQAEAALHAELADLIEIAALPRGKRRKTPSRTVAAEAMALLSVETTAKTPLPSVAIDRRFAAKMTSALAPLLRRVDRTAPDFTLEVGRGRVRGFGSAELVADDPHVVVRLSESELVIVINLQHPSAPDGLEGTALLSHLRQCVFDGLVAWTIDPTGSDGAAAVLAAKDQLLRLWADPTAGDQ
jgi:hypothetical protein